MRLEGHRIAWDLLSVEKSGSNRRNLSVAIMRRDRISAKMKC